MTNDREHYRNHFNICVERMSRAAMLQSERRAMGWRGAALFYQFEAARWQRKAEQARENYDAAKLGEDWANDLVDAVMSSYVAPRFEPADYFPPFDPVAFNSDLYAYALTGAPPFNSNEYQYSSIAEFNYPGIAWGTKTVSPAAAVMLISATDYVAPGTTWGKIVDGTIEAPTMNVATIKRPNDDDARCSCGTLFERCCYPNCNTRDIINR